MNSKNNYNSYKVNLEKKLTYLTNEKKTMKEKKFQKHEKFKIESTSCQEFNFFFYSFHTYNNVIRTYKQTQTKENGFNPSTDHAHVFLTMF